MPEQIRIFDYLLTDAWHFPISQVSVFEGDPCWVRFTQHKGKFSINELSDQDVEIERSIIGRIKDILLEMPSQELEWLQHTLVEDGFIEEFSYYNGKEVVRLTGYNIWCCLERPELYPNAMKAINVLDRIADVLVPLGVGKQCFALEPNSRSKKKRRIKPR